MKPESELNKPKPKMWDLFYLIKTVSKKPVFSSNSIKGYMYNNMCVIIH